MKKIIIVSFIILCAVSTVIYKFPYSENSKKQLTSKEQNIHDNLSSIAKDSANLDATTIDQKTKISEIAVVKVDEQENQEKLKNYFSDWADTFNISHSGSFYELKFSFTQLSYFPSNGTKGVFSFVYDDNKIVHMGRFVENGKESEISSYSNSFNLNDILKNCDDFINHEGYFNQINDININNCDDKNFFIIPGEAVPFYGFTSLENPNLIHLYAVTGDYKKEFFYLEKNQKPIFMKDLIEFQNGEIYQKQNLENILSDKEYIEFLNMLEYLYSDINSGKINIKELQSNHMDDVWFERSEEIKKIYDEYKQKAG